MARKKNNNKTKTSWFKYLLFIGFLWKTFRYLRHRKDEKTVRRNLVGLVRQEEKEIEKFIRGKEAPATFFEHSVGLFRDYFIPGSHNCHKPKILRRKALVIIALLAIILKSSALGYLFFVYPNEGRATADIAKGVVELVNQHRQEAGLEPLDVNEALSRSALAKAEDMVYKDYFSHQSPDGRKPWDWIDRQAYDYLYVGENLAMNFTSAQSVHHALMQSPSHKKNIMNDLYEHIGIAVISGELNGQTTNILVQMFGSRSTRHLALETKEDSTAGTTKEQVVESEPKIESLLGQETSVAGFEREASEAALEEDSRATAGQAAPVPEKKEAVEPIEAQPEPESDPQPVEEKSSLKESVEEMSAPVSEDIEPAVDSAVAAKDARAPGPRLVSEFTSYAVNSSGLERQSQPKLFAGQALMAMKNIPDEAAAAGRWMVLVQYVILSLLGLVVVALALHILIRKEVHHRPVLIEAMLFILFVGGILSVRLHFLEYGIPRILIL